jgi:hypothetical protein
VGAHGAAALLAAATGGFVAISSSMTRAGTPASSSQVAKVWRRSWGPSWAGRCSRPEPAGVVAYVDDLDAPGIQVDAQRPQAEQLPLRGPVPTWTMKWSR